MDISVVILTWNSEEYIEKCLSSFMAGFKDGNATYEIFVVDNGSQDETKSVLKSYCNKFPDLIKPIYLKENTGTTFSRNLALKRAKGDFIVVMDSDIEVAEGTIEYLIDLLKKDERAGMAVPQLVYPDGRVQKSTDQFPTVVSKLFRAFFLKLIEKKEGGVALESGVRKVDYAISAMWVLKRDVIDRVGLLDENIFYAPEDVDYCLRIWKGGYRILFAPHVSTVHDAQEISRGFVINRAVIEHIKGLIYYFRKHHYCMKKPEFH